MQKRKPTPMALFINKVLWWKYLPNSEPLGPICEPIERFDEPIGFWKWAPVVAFLRLLGSMPLPSSRPSVPAGFGADPVIAKAREGHLEVISSALRGHAASFQNSSS
jgi:hypothetical protein